MESNCSAIDTGNFALFTDKGTEDELNGLASLEFNETPELKEECLEKLKTLIRDHETPCLTSDAHLLSFLRTKKFDVQRSFELLKNYGRKRADNNDHVMQLQPDVLTALLETTFIGILPYRDTEGRIIVFRRLGLWDLSVCPFMSAIAAGFAVFDYVAQDPMTQIRGIVIIVDNVGLSLAESMASIRYLNTWGSFLFGCFPARFSKVYILNPSFLLKWSFKFLKPYLSEKIKSRVIFCEDKRNLLENISPNILPEEFGGTNGPLSNDHLIKPMEEYLLKMQRDQVAFLR